MHTFTVMSVMHAFSFSCPHQALTLDGVKSHCEPRGRHVVNQNYSASVHILASTKTVNQIACKTRLQSDDNIYSVL